jgi:hypothetical protein
VELDPQALRSGDDIEALHREQARCEAVVTRATSAFEVGREWEASGAKSAAAWVSNHCGLSDAGARRRISGQIVLRQLRCIEDELFEADWAEATVTRPTSTPRPLAPPRGRDPCGSSSPSVGSASVSIGTAPVCASAEREGRPATEGGNVWGRRTVSHKSGWRGRSAPA